MEKIIIFHEHHGDLFYNASTNEQLYNVCLKILQRRYESGDYYFFDEEDKPQLPKISRKEAEKIIDEDVKICALSKIDDYEQELKEFNEDKKFFEQVKNVINLQDGKLAYQLLRQRADADSEGFEIKGLDNIDNY